MENWQKQIDEFRPDRVSKSTRTDRRAHTFAQLLTPNRSVSSANWRWDTVTGSCSPILYLVNRFCATTTSINTFRHSAAKRKRNGDNRSPFQRPCSRENSSVGLPLTKTDAVVVLTNSLIPFLHEIRFSGRTNVLQDVWDNCVSCKMQDYISLIAYKGKE
jgi:hypothetical protein